MSPGAVLALVVQQARAYIFQNGVRAVEPDRVGLLNFNDAQAAQALDAKQVPGNLR